MFEVLFHKSAAGNEVVLNILRGLPADDKRTVGEDLKTLQLGYPIGMPLCRQVGTLWELRSTLPSRRELRLLWFFHKASQTIIVVHAFIKKTQKTPRKDIDLGEARKGEYR